MTYAPIDYGHELLFGAVLTRPGLWAWLRHGRVHHAIERDVRRALTPIPADATVVRSAHAFVFPLTANPACRIR